MAYEEFEAVPDAHRLGTTDYTPEQRQQIKAVQARADAVLREYGRTSPEPHHDETPFRYRTRLAEVLARETVVHRRGLDLSKVPSAEYFERKESAIYADALQQAKHPLDLEVGQFREIKKSAGGREYSEFVTGAHSDGTTRGAFKALYRDFIGPVHGNAIGPGRGADDTTVVPIPYVPA